MSDIQTDVLVIGAGLAGLYAAIICRLQGAQVLVCSKSTPGRGSCSAISQGIFRTSTSSLTPEEHAKMTLEAGKDLNQKDKVNLLVQNAARDVQRLQDFGVNLCPGSKGFSSWVQQIGQEGMAITKPVTIYSRSIGVEFYSPFFAWQLASSDNRVAGCWGFEPGNNEPVLLKSRSVILAAGGASALYAPTDNPQGMAGDGYALACKAGLPLMDMEFIQFYPLCRGKSRTSRLLPPFVGELGRLENVYREDIVSKYSIQPRPVALSARDTLCQAMALEAEAGLNFQDGGFRLRIFEEEAAWSKVQKDFGLENIAKIKAWLKNQMDDQGYISVRPAAHFCMGGIATGYDVDTTMDCLFAAGEVAGGLHGANRLGGNALAETAVFGRISAEKAVQAVQDHPDPQWSRLQVPEFKLSSISEAKTQACLTLRHELQDMMWQKAGILRSAQSLNTALQELQQLSARLEELANSLINIKTLEMDNMLQISEAIARSALARTESRGSHYRHDYPLTDEALCKHILLQKTRTGLELSEL